MVDLWPTVCTSWGNRVEPEGAGLRPVSGVNFNGANDTWRCELLVFELDAYYPSNCAEL